MDSLNQLAHDIWTDRNSDDVKKYDGTRVTVDREKLVQLVRSLGVPAYSLAVNSQSDRS